MKELKLSDKERTVIETIRKSGTFKVQNNQNPTVTNLISKGICEYNSRYDALILTKLGDKIEL